MRFYVHRLGCPKNDVDADYIAARLIAEGHIPVKDPERAESIIVNTCGFILPAKEQSIDEILRLGELKRKGNLKLLYASGCLSQRNGDELLAGMPELDGAFGLGALDSLAEAVNHGARLRKTVKRESRQLGYLTWKDRFLTDDYPYAYLKISDGCNRGCTYCAIPSIRGRYRSRPLDSILTESRFLADNGKKELILVSQEATMWGRDFPEKQGPLSLLDSLSMIDGIDWIRLMYLYPSELDDELIDYIGLSGRVLDYFDLPLQHCNTEVLKRMRRPTDRHRLDDLLSRIRTRAPKATIRTTFIVGFPGETDEQFEELFDFVRQWEFDRLGVFTYSEEDGTPAARYEKRVPEEVKQERMDRLMSLQHDIAVAGNNSLIGSVEKVIIDRQNEDGLLVGRTRRDCPEIDPEVLIEGDLALVGSFCQVKIDAVAEYDLIGTIVVD